MPVILTPLASTLCEGPDAAGRIAREFGRIAGVANGTTVLGQFWYGLHFTLCGEVPFPSTEAARLGVEWLDEPLQDALMGGEAARVQDDFGGARFHRPPAVSKIAQALTSLTEEYVREGFSPETLTQLEIPPAGWDDPSAVHRILADFRQLVAFYTHCHISGAGALLRVLRS